MKLIQWEGTIIRLLDQPYCRISTKLSCAIVLAFTIVHPHASFAGPILFDFESPPVSDFGDGKNPTFTQNGISVTFTSEFSIAPDGTGVAQWIHDSRTVPYKGTGSMRLSYTGMNAFPNVGILMTFSARMSSVELYASRFSTSPFTILAYDGNDNVLASRSLVSVQTYEQIQFSGLGPIAALRFQSIANYGSFDEMIATCDDDMDADGIPNAVDNCPRLFNPDQADGDVDGVGDLCDACPNSFPHAVVDASGCASPIKVDFDHDGDVDQSDYAHLQICFSGSAPQTNPLCQDVILDADLDVDGNDLAIFLGCMRGADVAADPNCAP